MGLLHPIQCVGWHNLSISNSTLQMLKFENGKSFPHTLYWAYDYLFMLSTRFWSEGLCYLGIHGLCFVMGCSWSSNTMLWWRHQMEAFSALLTLCVGNPSLTRGFPSKRSVTQSFDVFFGMRLNKRLNKQTRCRWFETPWHSLCCHCNAIHQGYFTGTGATTWLTRMPGNWPEKYRPIYRTNPS